MKKITLIAGFCLLFSVMFFSCAAAPEVKETSPVEAPAPGTPVGASNDENSYIEASTTVTAGTSPQGSGIYKRTPLEIPPVPPMPPIPQTKTLPQAVSAGVSPGVSPVTTAISGSLQAARPPVRPWKPAVPEYIMGRGLIHPEDMTAFLLGSNPRAEKEFVKNLASIYAEETAIEGVNHDVAFAQMCLETGFLRYGGLVTPDMNNFCGLGAIGPGQTGAWFPDPRTGVRAHVQHLKAYATEAPLKQELVDPRYHYVRYGSSPAIKGLAGTWAADLSYAEKINGILERLINSVYEN